MRFDEDARFEVRRLTTYSSHSGTTSKMWILPNGKAVSIPCQHYEWALRHEDYLKRRFSINLRRARAKGDTAIRLHLLRHGCVRVNYEHKGGRLIFEAHHRHWGPHQIRGCREIIRHNVADISFVVLRLLNNRCLTEAEEFASLMDCSIATAMKKLGLSGSSLRNSYHGKTKAARSVKL